VKLDGARVREARGIRSPGDISAAMRRLPATPFTTTSWVLMVERGLLPVREEEATALAAVLGKGLADLLPAGQPSPLTLIRATDTLTALHDAYRAALSALTTPRLPPAAALPQTPPAVNLVFTREAGWAPSRASLTRRPAGSPDMPWVMICRGLAGRALTRAGVPPPIGYYLKSYDPEANSGQGEIEWTAQPAQAMTFPDQRAAFALWSRVPLACPVRADGKPNRPATAFTVEIAAYPGSQR
jgi:hypothetical protein